MEKDIKIFTEVIEEEAKQQVYELISLEAFCDAKVRIMPDVHAGKGCVIGFTGDLGDKVIPNIVGVDIGCGMLTIELGKMDLDLKNIDAYITENIPSGYHINSNKKANYAEEIEKIICLRELNKGTKFFVRSIGSLGGGNHFIEINEDKEQNKYLVIHSGSRNLGNQICSYYQKRAIEIQNGLSDAYLDARQRLIDDYKEKGRRKEIQNALKDLRKEYFVENSVIPKALCWLEGREKDNYLHDMSIAQRYAELNRETMGKRIVEECLGLDFDKLDYFHTTHNYIDFEDKIVRKGAIKANKQQKVLIPINMKDGSILAIGKGNPDWNCSAPHGAGRLMSRTKAKQTITLEEFVDSMKGIYTSSVVESTLDEAPMAYKDKEDILKYIGDTVDVIDVLKPIYNFKAK